MSGYFRCKMERQIGITREKKQEKLLRIVAGSGKSVTFAPATRKKGNGTLDEWLSQRSAKPRTAVRIRQVPQPTAKALLRNQRGFSFFLL